MDVAENKINATGGSTGNAAAASIPTRPTIEPLSRPDTSTTPVTEDMRPGTRPVIAQHSAAETPSAGTDSRSTSVTTDMPSTPVKIDEKFLTERLGISDAKGLLRALDSNGYIRNGEVTDSFARFFGPQDEFELSDAFKDIRSDVFYLLQAAYIHNISVKVKDENNRKIEAFEATFNSLWRRGLLFRDSALQRRYTLADAYLNLAGKNNMGYYAKSVETAKEITSSLYNTNSRKPLFWHESIFLMSSANYSKGLQTWNHATSEKELEVAKQYFRDGIKDLYIQYSNLNPMDSYLSAYCSQLLDVCANYYELTGERPYFTDDNGNSVAVGLPEIRAIFSKAKTSNGFWDTGFEGFVNRLTNNFMGNISKYMDYYLAAKTRINYARYCIAESGSGSAEKEDLACEAESQIQDALDVIDDIRSAPNNLKARWAIYNSGLFGGIREIYRGATGEGTDFVKSFGLYAALGHRVSSLQNLKKHDYQKSLADIEMAYSEISYRKKDAGSSFYLGGWDIKEAYFLIMSDYLDILMVTEDKENAKKAAILALGWLSDKTLSAALEDRNPRLYAKLQMIAETFGQDMVEQTASDSETQDQPAAGLGPWDFHDLALSDMFGLRKIWARSRTTETWTKTAENLLNAVANPNNKFVFAKDRPLLLARSHAWLGNLMKWAEEKEIDPATAKQICETAGVPDGAYKEAIISLYETALQEYKGIKDKALYLEAEEASTMYQLASQALEILEDNKTPVRLRCLADDALTRNSLADAKTALAEVVKKAEKPEDSATKENAITGYADCAAQEIIAELAQGNADEAYSATLDRFNIEISSKEIVAKSESLTDFCDNSDCKYYFDDEQFVVRGKMSAEDKQKLTELCPEKADKDAIEKLFNSSRNALVIEAKALGKTVPDTKDAVPVFLAIANALISKSFEEKDENGPITRHKVSELADRAETKILETHKDPSTAPANIQVQLADIAALRIYVAMGETTKENPTIPDEKIASVIKMEVGSTSAPVVPLTIKVKGKEIVVSDVFMQQKLKLALMNIWMRNGSVNSGLAMEWAVDITNNGLGDYFKNEASKMRKIF